VIVEWFMLDVSTPGIYSFPPLVTKYCWHSLVIFLL